MHLLALAWSIDSLGEDGCQMVTTLEVGMGESSMLRFGKFVPTDEVRDAWVSGDLERMLRAADLQTNLVDRHFLLSGIVKETYRRRSESEMASKCSHFSEMHLAELKTIAPALKADMDGALTRVPTFRNYATLLTEQGDFDRAIRVCERAKYYGLEDGTKAGFDGRIARIRKKQGPASHA